MSVRNVSTNALIAFDEHKTWTGGSMPVPGHDINGIRETDGERQVRHIKAMMAAGFPDRSFEDEDGIYEFCEKLYDAFLGECEPWLRDFVEHGAWKSPIGHYEPRVKAS